MDPLLGPQFTEKTSKFGPKNVNFASSLLKNQENQHLGPPGVTLRSQVGLKMGANGPRMHPRRTNLRPSWPNKPLHVPQARFCDPWGTPQDRPRQESWLPLPWSFDHLQLTEPCFLLLYAVFRRKLDVFDHVRLTGGPTNPQRSALQMRCSPQHGMKSAMHSSV